MAWKNFILSLGVRGLHGGGGVFADLAGDMGGPLSQGQGSLSPKTAHCLPHPRQECWGVPCLSGAPTEKTMACAFTKPGVP